MSTRTDTLVPYTTLFRSGNQTDSGDDPGAGRHVLVFAEAGKIAHLQERRAGIEQALDALPRQQLSLFHMSRARAFRATGPLLFAQRLELCDLLTEPGLVGTEGFRAGIEHRKSAE